MNKLAWRRIVWGLVAIVAAATATQYFCCRSREPVDPSSLPRERVVGQEGMLQPRATPEDEYIDPLALRAAADYAAAHATQALIVSRHGHVIFEQYWHDAGADTLIDAGAFHRTIVALVVGMALEDRKIGSVDEPVTAGASIERLLQTPDDTLQPLVPLIERATGERYASYVSRRLWKPLDAADASVATDRPGGIARADCCFFTRPADWLRIAQILMNGGVYQGTQIVQRRWIEQMLEPSKANPAMGMQVRLGYPRHGLHLTGSGGNRLWLVPGLQLAVLHLGKGVGDWDESRIPTLVLAGLQEQRETPKTDLSTLVPGH